MDLVVIGASRGGTEALAALLSALPVDMPSPLVVVLHRGSHSGELLLNHLQAAASLRVIEAGDKTKLERATVYLAPADYHLLVDKDELALSTGEPVSFARPSIDVLFESAADAWGEHVTGVILTGTNSDGARGLARIKSRGGRCVVQDPAEAPFPQMPKAALAAVAEAQVLTLAGIADLLVWGRSPDLRGGLQTAAAGRNRHCEAGSGDPAAGLET